MNVHSVGGTELSTSCSVLLWLVNSTWCPLQATVIRNMYVRMCLLWSIANQLSYSAIENLLKLLHLFCPSSHQIPSCLYMLKKFFRQYTSSYEKKRVCPSCHSVLKKGETCPRSHGQNGHMIRVPIEKALKSVVRYIRHVSF